MKCSQIISEIPIKICVIHIYQIWIRYLHTNTFCVCKNWIPEKKHTCLKIFTFQLLKILEITIIYSIVLLDNLKRITEQKWGIIYSNTIPNKIVSCYISNKMFILKWFQLNENERKNHSQETPTKQSETS